MFSNRKGLFVVKAFVLLAVYLSNCNLIAKASQVEQSKHEPSVLISSAAELPDYSSLVADNMINLGASQPSLFGKRARKMSAFMPMRGRKDGRDQEASLYGLGGSFGEIDADSPSILRLVADSRGELSPLIGLTGTPAPRQFANQLAARHMLLEPTGIYQTGEIGSEQMMQAKLRRAFHPMRGKKSSLFVPEINFSEDMQTD